MWTYGRIPASQVVERDEPDIGGGVVQRFIRRHIYSGLDGLAAKRSRKCSNARRGLSALAARQVAAPARIQFTEDEPKMDIKKYPFCVG